MLILMPTRTCARSSGADRCLRLTLLGPTNLRQVFRGRSAHHKMQGIL